MTGFSPGKGFQSHVPIYRNLICGIGQHTKAYEIECVYAFVLVNGTTRSSETLSTS